MNGQQHYWDLFFAWCLGLGFLLTLILVIAGIVFMYDMVDHGKSVNPFGPFIRAFERWHKNRENMKYLRTRANLVKKGLDPEYVKVLEKELEKKLDA